METEKKSDFKKFNWNELSWKDSFFLSLKTYLYFMLFLPIPFSPIWAIMGLVGFENLSSPILYFVGAYNAENHSQIYLDIAHEVAVSSYMSSGSSIDDYQLRGVLELFRDNLIQARQYGYCIIAFLMGVGTILILAGSKTIEEGQQTLVR